MLLFAIITMIIIIIKIPIIIKITMDLLFISLLTVAGSLNRKLTEITIIAKIIFTKIISMNQLVVNKLTLQIAQQA